MTSTISIYRARSKSASPWALIIGRKGPAQPRAILCSALNEDSNTACPRSGRDRFQPRENDQQSAGSESREETAAFRSNLTPCGMLKEDGGRVRKGSGPRVMAVLRNLIIDLCSFSGKTSLAAANRHGHVPTREVGGTRVIPNRRMKRPCTAMRSPWHRPAVSW